MMDNYYFDKIIEKISDTKHLFCGKTFNKIEYDKIMTEIEKIKENIEYRYLHNKELNNE
jgi:hypothetical protein